LPSGVEVESMVDLYDDQAIDYFEEEEDMDSSDLSFMRGYLAA